MWDQVLLRKLRLKTVAEFLLKIQLKLFAQSLLADDYFYDNKASEYGFKINKKINFISKTTMCLGSIFEFLNLKIGQPTRQEMLFWLKFFGLKQKLSGYINDIINFCIASDVEFVQSQGHAFQFFEIQKETGSDTQFDSNTPYVCPKCKSKLSVSEYYFCNHCNIQYPVVEDVPIFLSYREKIKGFNSYINRKKGLESEEFVT
jgi:hypothetical protein